MQEYVQTGTELLIGFIALFLYTKVLGKAHFSKLTPFDFISALILGELLGNAVYDPDVTIREVLYAIGIWGLLLWSIVMLTQRFGGLRKSLEGEPTVLIRRGELQFKALQDNRLDLNQLQTLLRQKGFFSMKQVEYAILETNGMLSVMPKWPDAPPTRQDLDLPARTNKLPVSLILDGYLVRDNLKEAGVDEGWLKKRLAAQGFYRYEDVFFAEWNDYDDLYIASYSKEADG
ncbi:DUF421 domain-containing protein [Paenibacillus sp. TRM 82003]|nr:DUF421 domain-containing protein [Paenibacillus sp. TRM 82003]